MNSYITDELLKRRTVVISGPIEDETANSAYRDLLLLDSEDTKSPISVFVDSPGGQVSSTLAVVDTMNFVTAPVHVYGLTRVQGSAMLILIAGEIGHRHCQPNCRLALPALEIQNLDVGADVHLSRLIARLVSIIQEQTKMTEMEAQQTFQHGRSFTVQEAVDLGIVDAVDGH